MQAFTNEMTNASSYYFFNIFITLIMFRILTHSKLTRHFKRSNSFLLNMGSAFLLTNYRWECQKETLTSKMTRSADEGAFKVSISDNY